MKFGQKGQEATYSEILYLYQITCLKPIKVAYLDQRQRKTSIRIANMFSGKRMEELNQECVLMEVCREN